MHFDTSSHTAVFAGCARNVAEYLPKTRRNMERIGAIFSAYRMVFFENDSNDSTLAQLRSWKSTAPYDVQILTEPLTLEHRIDRISFGRNRCLEEINRLGWQSADYLIMMDMDDVGSNDALHTDNIRICFESASNWDAIFANQHHHYYDQFALRTQLYDHNPWAPDGIIRRYGYPQNLRHWFSAECVPNGNHIDQHSGLLPVLSAFGGLGIYRMEAIIGLRYEPRHLKQENGEDDRDCEHVDLHRKMRARGYNRLFIHPRLINIHSSRLYRLRFTANLFGQWVKRIICKN